MATVNLLRGQCAWIYPALLFTLGKSCCFPLYLEIVYSINYYIILHTNAISSTNTVFIQHIKIHLERFFYKTVKCVLLNQHSNRLKQYHIICQQFPIALTVFLSSFTREQY